jgi:hypothetical protein
MGHVPAVHAVVENGSAGQVIAGFGQRAPAPPSTATSAGREPTPAYFRAFARLFDLAMRSAK